MSTIIRIIIVVLVSTIYAYVVYPENIDIGIIKSYIVFILVYVIGIYSKIEKGNKE